jgi:D-galactarolactone cycloisomerase
METIVLRVPLKLDGPAPMMSGQRRTSMDTLLVRVDTDAGISGWGEAFGHRIWPATRAAIDHMLAPACMGADPTAIEALMDRLRRSFYGAGRGGAALYALSGIDIALWDIAGKIAGQPLYRLLGGGHRTDLPAYASLLHLEEPDAIRHYVRQALARGYGMIKIHETKFEQIRIARETAGEGYPLMCDCNCPWTVEEATAMARRLQPLELTWLEEPVWPPEDHAGLAQVRRETGIATAAGENAATLHSFRHLLEAGALSYAQPSVAKIGGVSEMRKVIALAEAGNVRVVPHSAYFGPGLIASMHVIAAMPGVSPVERFYCDFERHVLGEAINPVNGRIAVPQGPGLGVEPDPQVIAAFRLQ